MHAYKLLYHVCVVCVIYLLVRINISCNLIIFCRFSDEILPEYRWYKIFHLILTGKTVSVCITKVTEAIYPSVTAYGIQLPGLSDNHSVVDLVSKDLLDSQKSENHSSTQSQAQLTDSNGSGGGVISEDREKSQLEDGINHLWRDSLIMEFEETFKCELLTLKCDELPPQNQSSEKTMETNSDRETLVQDSDSITINKSGTPDIDCKSVLRKRLLSQLDTSISSPFSIPRSKLRLFSPGFKPTTSTPRHTNTAPNACSNNLFDSSLGSSFSEHHSSSKQANGNMSADLFSEITEGLSSLSCIDTDNA